jgi:hypothetical protein
MRWTFYTSTEKYFITCSSRRMFSKILEEYKKKLEKEQGNEN